MTLELRPLRGAALEAALDDLAALRITVFREWPYLYDGDMDYERRYLETYTKSADAILIGAFNGARLVGAATGTPMADHAEDFAAPLADHDIPLEDCFYCAESVLLADYRGQGAGHGFFDLREAHARTLGFSHSVFCAVVRESDHPARPVDYRPLDSFWRKRGYVPLSGAIAHFPWKDLGVAEETTKPLQVWHKRL